MERKFVSSISIILVAILILTSCGNGTPQIDPEVLKVPDAAYYIDYNKGTIPLGDLPIGARVIDPTWEWEFRTGDNYSGPGEKKPVTWIVVAKNHYSGLESHVTLLSEELIGLYTFDNSTERVLEFAELGYNHWGESGTGTATYGLRPWLNSTGIHSGEGFYRAFSESFKNAVLLTDLPNKEGLYGNPYTTSDDVFIPSTTELGDTRHVWTYQIGSAYPFFAGSDAKKRLAWLANETKSYWTRSPGFGDGVRIVYYTGDFYYENGLSPDPEAYFGLYGVRPALNLKAGVLVSGIIDTNDGNEPEEPEQSEVLVSDDENDETALEEDDNGIEWKVGGSLGEYTGQLIDGTPNGHGVWQRDWSDTKYEGNWVNGEIHGHGVYIYGSGSFTGRDNRYNGEWNKGKWHGRGEYISADGFSIDGLWENNNLVGIRTSSEDNISSEIKNRVNTVKKTNKYFLDPLLSNFGLTRKEVLDKNGTPSTIVPYYSGFYSFGGGPIDYYCYNKLNACFMFCDDGKDGSTIVKMILLKPGAKFLNIEIGKTSFVEISSLLGKPVSEGSDEWHFYTALYDLTKGENNKYPITVWFYGNINNGYPSWAEIEFSMEARYFIFD